MARAVNQVGGRFRAHRSEPVQNASRLLADLRASMSEGAEIIVGFDFPIGLPGRYAEAAGIVSFTSFLGDLGSGRWPEFFDVAESPDQISFSRPFYPQRPGGCKQGHLLRALDVSNMDALRRRCELPQPGRRAACPLFWTLGGQQVGKAAIAGWKEVLVPAARDEGLGLAIWPFDGSLEDVLKPGRTVVVETYPAEFYGHLGVRFPASQRGLRSGKRVSRDRAANAEALLKWAVEAGVEIDEELRLEIEDGFGDRKDGEDRFDAVVGLFGMLNVLLGRRPPGPPDDPQFVNIEGWILGQSAS